jgi:hypothetical protein
MPRALRIEHPGAIYHLLNRGDPREPSSAMTLDLAPITSQTQA